MNILISPLNWGIGHATRISPIIKILSKTHNVFIAADGNSLAFLKQTFPNIKILKAPKLNIRYTSIKFLMPIKVLALIPKLLVFYIKNRIWITKYQNKNKLDFIISDNRFGFFSKNIKSIFIGHQIRIKTPNSLKIFERIIFEINKKNIEKFSELWIPDNSKFKISGDLSSPKNIKIPVHFIGLLSRFDCNNNLIDKIDYQIAAILSGPEPQRKILETKLETILLKINKKTIILEGKPLENKNYINNNLKYVSHVDTLKMQNLILNSEIIIARAGYSTIMDLIKLKKTAILIPTPGQTEQEYLANYLHDNKLFYCVRQKNLCNKTIEEFELIKDQLKNNINEIACNSNLENFLSFQTKT